MSRLVVERKVGTSVSIGDDVEVTVERVRGKRAVRLAIKAPRSVPIVRDDTTTHSVRPSARPIQSNLRVTVVEDDPSHARLIGLAFADNGVSHVSVKSTGQDAIACLDEAGLREETRPQLVMLDLNLPDMSGLDVLRHLRGTEAYRFCPIVILSSHADEEHVASCLNAGATAYIAKDSRYEELRDSVARVAEFWGSSRFVA